MTFGSVTAGAHLPYFPALYRSAIDALAPLPVRVLLTIGDRRDHDELGPLPPNVHVEEWVAQEAVAPHAAAIVGHGGHGTTLGALAHGVPLVVVPLFSVDQWANAAAVARTGAGVALDAEPATRRVLGLPGPGHDRRARRRRRARARRPRPPPRGAADRRRDGRAAARRCRGRDAGGDRRRYIRRYDAPLTSITVPLAIVASGEARKTTAAATSSGAATRPSGLSARLATPFSPTSSSPAMSVSVKPGATDVTAMPCGPSARASDWPNAISPALLAP